MTMQCPKCGKNYDTTGHTCFGSVANDLRFYREHKLGWECPLCHRIYAPWVPDCHRCNALKEPAR